MTVTVARPHSLSLRGAASSSPSTTSLATQTVITSPPQLVTTLTHVFGVDGWSLYVTGQT